MEEKEPIFSYTPKAQTNQDQVSSIAEDIKAKYPAPNSTNQIQSQGSAFDTPSSLFSQPKNDYKVSFKDYSVKADEIYTQLSDGSYQSKYKNYIQGTDNNERLAQSQTSGEQWSNGLVKLVGKTSTAVLGGTIGSVVGLGELISTGSLSAMYNNDFNKYLDTLNEKMDYKLPNYYTEQERNENFGQSLDNTNFWANDVLGGLSFTLGTIVSEGIWAAATGGAGLAVSGARVAARAGLGGFKTAAQLARANAKAAKLGKAFLRGAEYSGEAVNKVGRGLELFNTARFTYTSAGYEAGVEARTFMKEAEENYRYTFEQQNGRPPSPEEYAAFNVDMVNTANTVFTINTALVGSSNLAVFGRMYGLRNPFKSTTSGVNKSLFGLGTKQGMAEGRKVLEVLKPTKLQKFAGKTYGILKAPAVEGVWEEGMQAVTSNGAQAWLNSTYDANATKENISLSEAAYEGLSHTYGTKEGWKEVGIGMIIGLVGGGIATGGKFNEVSKSRKDLATKVGEINTFSAENTLENFKIQNQVSQAVKDIEKAEASNDLLGKDLATRRLLYTNARANARFGRDEASEDFKASLQGLDNDYFASIGIDVSTEEGAKEAQDLKDSLYTQYKDVQKQYKTNRTTAEYLVGRSQLEGVDNTEELIESVAYNITMGEQSDKFASQAFEAIEENMTDELGVKIVGGIKIRTTLDKAHKNTRERFYYHRNKLKAATEELSKAELELRDAQAALAAAPRENNITVTKRLAKAQENLLKITERKTSEENLMNQTYAMAQAENPYSGTANVLESDLEAADTNLNEGEKYLDNLKETNPQKFRTLEKLFKEYHKANYAFRQFNETVQGLTNDNLKMQEASNALSKKIFGQKTPNEFTKEFFIKNLEAYRGDFAETQGEFLGNQFKNQTDKKNNIEDKLFKDEKLSPEEQEVYNSFKEEIDTNVKSKQLAERILDEGQDFLTGDDLTFFNENKDKINQIISEKEKGDRVKSKSTEEEKKNSLEDRIENAIKNNSVVLNYVGDSIDDVMSKKPTTKERDEFESLYNNESRTDEEESRYQELLEKLTNWRVVDGSIDPNGYSLADLIRAKEQQDAKPTTDNVKQELTHQETIEIGTVSEKDASATRSNVNFIQTYENVKVKVSSSKKDFVFSHLNIESILNLFPVDLIKVQLAGDKGKKDFTPKLLADNRKEPGTKFEITLGDQKIVLLIEERGRISIPIEEFRLIEDKLGFKLINPKLTKTSYFDVYNKIADIFRPKGSDFKVETSEGGEVILLEVQEIENLEAGDKVGFRVNPNSVFNTALKEEYNNAKTKEAKKEVKDKIIKSLEIYTQTEDGKVIGVTKITNKKTNKKDKAQDNHLALRQFAAQQFIKNIKSNSSFILKSVVPVQMVLLGSPDLVLEETEDGLVPKNISITDAALEQIVDFGFIENGKIVTNEKAEDSDIVKDFIKSVGKNERVPFIVFKHGNKKVAYPVSLVTTANPASNAVVDINNTETLTAGEKIVKINDILLENGISPQEYDLMNTDAEIIDKKIDEIIERLVSKEIKPDLNNWLESNKSILKTEAIISIDLENRPLKSPKVMLDFAAAELSEEIEQVANEAATIETEVEESLFTPVEIDFGQAEEVILGAGFPKVTEEQLSKMSKEQIGVKIGELQKERDKKLIELRDKDAKRALSELKAKFPKQFENLTNEVQVIDVVDRLQLFANQNNDDVLYNQTVNAIKGDTKTEVNSIIDGFDFLISKVQNYRVKTIKSAVTELENQDC